MPTVLFYINSLDQAIIRSAWLVFVVTKFIAIPVLNANSVVPDQMPRYAASDLGLYCLLMSLYGTLGINRLTGSEQMTSKQVKH